MFFVTPLKQLFTANQQFAKLTGKTNGIDIILTKIVFVLCHLVTIGAGIWKLGQMGLLPNTRSDWLAWEQQPTVLERSI